MLFKFKALSRAKGKTIKKQGPAPTLVITSTPSLRNDVPDNSENSDEEQGDEVTMAEFFIQDTAKHRKQKQGQNERRKTLGGRIIPEPLRITHADEAKNQTPANLQPLNPIFTLPPNERTPPQSPNPSIHLLLGPQDPHSPYLTRRYFLLPSTSPLSPSPYPFTSALEQLTPLHLPSLDPHAFSLYSIYTHTGNIPIHYPDFHYPTHHPPPQYTWQEHWPLINAHILGCMIGEPEFADRVMDLLREKVRGGRPDEETISHLFKVEREGVSDVLRRFVVDEWIENEMTEVGMETLPVMFIGMALNHAMGRLSRVGAGARREECEYHVHDNPRDCYRTRVSATDMRKKERLERERETSRKDSSEAVANAKQNGVKSIDWEARKMEAHRALMKTQTRRRAWAGSTRLNGGEDPKTSPTSNPQDTENNTLKENSAEPNTHHNNRHPTTPSPIELEGTSLPSYTPRTTICPNYYYPPFPAPTPTPLPPSKSPIRKGILMIKVLLTIYITMHLIPYPKTTVVASPAH